MDHAQQCADGAIDKFAKNVLGGEYWPNWADLTPGDDTSGWGADKGSWRLQSGQIISAFESCVGVKISCPGAEIDALRSMTLSDFSDYLVEKAQISGALLAVKVARSHLASVKASIKMFRVGS